MKNLLDLIKKGDLETVKAEAERMGISLGSIQDDNYHHNGIFYATLIKEEPVCMRMVEYLLSLGVDACAVDSLSQTALFYSAREGKPELVDVLVKHGCFANHLDTYGQTPIFYAAREGHLEVMKRLVVYGADPDLVDKNGQTPLFYAVRGGKLDAVEFLIENGVNVNHEDKKQQTAMHIAKRSNKQQIMNLLTSHGAKALEDLRKQQNKQRGRPPASIFAVSHVDEKKAVQRYVLTSFNKDTGLWEPLANNLL